MSPLNGFETRELVLAQLSALEREAAGHIRGDRHRDEIQAQIKIFKKALKELEAAGDPVEEKRRGTATSVRNSTTGRDYLTWMS